MHITRVELENVKSHRHATFEFQRGTTAIMGANGAGKTTIIEAVAWTLFDLLDYKKDDFARRGSKNKGVARVTFQSDLDEREYTVYRDTGTGYYVYDPQLKIRIAEKKEEVTRFLRQHLGVEAGTDLEALFRRAIGVPQGTFTAIFLESAAERKKAFDKLLKVEEYRQGAERLRETVNFVRTKVNEVNVKIARAEGELLRFESVETGHRAAAEQIAALSATLEESTREVAERTAKVEKLGETEAKVNELKSVRDHLQAESAKAEIVRGQREREHGAAQAAAEKIRLVEADYKAHLDALAELKNLEAERAGRDRLRNDLTRIETEIVNRRAEQKSFAENLQRVSEAYAKIVDLKPLAEQEKELEAQRDQLKAERAAARETENSIKSLEEKIARLRENFKENSAKLKESEAKSAGAPQIEILHRRETELTQTLAQFRATLERDEKFHREMQNGLCPILSEKCRNLSDGQTLEGVIKTQSSTAKQNIITLEVEHKEVFDALKAAREAEKHLGSLEAYRRRETEIKDEGTRLKAEQDALKARVENLSKVETRLAEIEEKIKSLGNPKARLLSFESEIKREAEIREKLAAAGEKLTRLEEEKARFAVELSKFETLDARMKNYAEERDRTSNAHREYLSNEAAAKALDSLAAELAVAAGESARLRAELEKAEAEFLAASKSYDRQQHLSERAALLEAEKRLAETRATLAAAEKSESELARELQRLKIIRLSMQDEFREKERLEKILETTDFIRETLKEAAPRVARNYVYHVSLEANQMFREITGNAERTLKWTEDYGIILEENGYERPFINLSGGEQMAAALSVRLALLKQLSDVRLAFFDEPTTNMDAARRERLAEQISHITERKTFDQLFVISHDDTFEGYVDNVISVGANENE